MDQELARRAGEAGRLRFEMGRGLDLLQRSGGDHALGFSSIEAYALERCERSASWTQKARALASRLEALPVLADALVRLDRLEHGSRAGEGGASRGRRFMAR